MSAIRRHPAAAGVAVAGPLAGAERAVVSLGRAGDELPADGAGTPEQPMSRVAHAATSDRTIRSRYGRGGEPAPSSLLRGGENVKQRPLRIAGIVLALGVAIGVLAVIGEAQLDGIASSDRTLWVADHLALWVGVALVLLASPALYARQHREVGFVGMVGFALLFIGTLAGLAFTAETLALLFPWVYDKASCSVGCNLLSTTEGPPLVGTIIPGADLLTGAGFILFGLTTARAAVLSRGASYLMALAGALVIVGTVVPSDELFVVGRVSAVVGFVAAAWMGLGLWTDEVSEPAVLSRT